MNECPVCKSVVAELAHYKEELMCQNCAKNEMWKDSSIQREIERLEQENKQLKESIPKIIRDFTEEFDGIVYDETQEKTIKELLDVWLPAKLKEILGEGEA